MGLGERRETESREPRGRQRAKFEKQNGRESLGFFFFFFPFKA